MSRRYKYDYDTSSSSDYSSSSDDDDFFNSGLELVKNVSRRIRKHKPDPGPFDIRANMQMIFSYLDRKGVFYVPFAGTTPGQLLSYMSYIFCLYQKIRSGKNSKHYDMDSFICDPCKITQAQIDNMINYLRRADTNVPQNIVNQLPTAGDVITNKKDILMIVQYYNSYKMLNRLRAVMGQDANADEIYERQLGSMLSKKGFGTFMRNTDDVFAPKALFPCGQLERGNPLGIFMGALGPR